MASGSAADERAANAIFVPSHDTCGRRMSAVIHRGRKKLDPAREDANRVKHPRPIPLDLLGLQGLLPARAIALLKPYFEQSRHTLGLQDSADFASWEDKVRVASRGPRFLSPAVPEGIQASIFEALLADPQLKVRRFSHDYGGPLMRLHVGLEDPADLIADLRHGLDAYARAA